MKALITPKTKLDVYVSHKEGKGRAKVVSHITVRAGSIPVAYAILGGCFTESQALAELKRLPSRFKLQEGYVPCKTLNLV